MFLNDIVKYIDEESDLMSILFIPLLILIATWVFIAIDFWIPTVIITLILAEWAYISKVRNTKEKLDGGDLVICKLGYIFLSIPIAMMTTILSKYYKNVLYFFYDYRFFFIIGILICAGIILYFGINITIGKAMNKKYKKKR